MENSTVNATPLDDEPQDKATAPYWRRDERRTDNRILSALVRNAERKFKAKSVNRQQPEDDVKA